MVKKYPLDVDIDIDTMTYKKKDLQTDIYINPQTKYWAKKPRCIDRQTDT